MTFSTNLDIDPTKIKPTGNKILVKQNKKQQATESGIVLKQYTMDKNDYYRQTFTAVAVGPKVLNVKAGDIIAVDWNKELGGDTREVLNKVFRLNQADEQYYFFKEESVVGIWDKEPSFD